MSLGFEFDAGCTAYTSSAFSGSRVTFGVQYSRSHANLEGRVSHYILDFNTSQQALNFAAAEETFDDQQSVAVSRRAIGSQETAFSMGLRPAKGIFDWTKENVVRQLPCICTRLSDVVFHEDDDVYLDDMCIVKVQRFISAYHACALITNLQSVYSSEPEAGLAPTTIYVF